MRFAVSLVRLLCAIIAGAVLVAFLYFIGQGAEYRTVTMVSMVLFIAALLIWALVAAIGDGWLRKVSDNNFYQKMTNQPDGKAMTALITESMDKIADKVSKDDEAKHQVLLSEFQSLSEKLAALNEAAPVPEEKTEASDNSEELRIIAENMQKIEMQIAELQNVVKTQMKTIEDMLQSSGQWETAPRVYPQLTEEAAYPESVVDYTQEQEVVEQGDFSADVAIAPEEFAYEEQTGEVDEQIEEPAVSEKSFDNVPLENAFEGEQAVEEVVDDNENVQDTVDEPLENAFEEEQAVEEAVFDNDNVQDTVDESLDSFLEENNGSENVDFEMPADLSFKEDIELPEEVEKVDLGADDPFGSAVELTPAEDVDIVTAEEADTALDLGADDPFGSAVELTPAEDVDIVAETEADTALDLGADDPFGASVEVVADTKEEPVFEPEHHTIDLGADNPFGTSVDVGSPVDIDAIEPAANVKKNEPNLDHIFNDELASELADLEILNDKKDDDKDDLDLEQFFAGHRKSLG